MVTLALLTVCSTLICILPSTAGSIGGLIAKRHEFRSTLLIRTGSPEMPRCGGLLFSQDARYVLTSTSCSIPDLNSAFVYASVHESSFEEITQQVGRLAYKVDLLTILNPQLALYRLVNDFMQNEYVVSVFFNSMRAQDETIVRALGGWISTNIQNPQPNENKKLRKVLIPVVDESECSKQTAGLPPNSRFCGGKLEGGLGGCGADTGSPLQCYTTTKTTREPSNVCGILIKGSSGKPREYDVYANIAYYAAAIKDAIENDNL